MSSAISQLSCYHPIKHRLQRHTKSTPCPSLRQKVLVVMSHDGYGTEKSRSEAKTTISYSAEASNSHNGRSTKSYPTTKEHAAVHEHLITQQKRAAKIHDFCFGIPFGGLVFCGGLVDFIFSRNPATLSTSVLFGGALLTLSTLSLKFWRQGKSSFQFILGQAVLSAVLIWKNFLIYSLTKKLFPTGIFAVISAGMLCFYLYVVTSGGNPPPKKLKSSAAVSSE
ncbi:protein FATTY ACID EXPORT 1, chloroplastic-like isoform X2 [Cornus florida]|nr:protein FATTY ACID EXPORT 1, chloroplastic-like isoform X2 [Cornus florida]